MAVKFKCFRCRKELCEPGALIFSPPNTNAEAAQVTKFHICVSCFGDLEGWLTDIIAVASFLARNKKVKKIAKKPDNLGH